MWVVILIEFIYYRCQLWSCTGLSLFGGIPVCWLHLKNMVGISIKFLCTSVFDI